MVANSWIITGARKIDINLRNQPCLQPAEAAKISGARKEPFFFTSHGEKIGETYSIEAGMMLLRFTTDIDYECVESINILELSKAVQNGGMP